jgi:serine/threonine-protein kinase
MSAAAQSPVEIGSLIAGKYRVERVLGQGGMGVVVVAMHDELDQRVAIKFLLRDAMTDAEWVARFSREAKAAARIKSEHAVKVYDVGKLESGAPYMVMEYLEGRDLQTILNDRRRIAVDEAVEYLLQACEAIAEAHSAGIVHRDLKPANLFVTHRTDGSPCVKILDFGISKMTSLTGADTKTMTSTSAIVGSPLYMSPEQMRASKNVDRRTDIWSIGVILQELVSGEPSFVANTTAELCALVLTAPPSPLQLENAPRGLANVIDKCLQKNAEERYGTIAELARALEPFGPPSVKTSVERIVRLATGQRPQQPSMPSGLKEISGPVSIVPAGQQAVSSLGQTELSASPQAAAEPPTAPAIVGAGTNAAWGSSRGQSAARPKMSRLPFIVALGIVAALGVLAIAVAIVSKPQPSTLGRASTDPTQAPTPTQTQGAAIVTTTSTSTPTATATLTATATSATTATATTGGTATAAHTSTAKPPASGKRNPTGPVDTSGFGGRN